MSAWVTTSLARTAGVDTRPVQHCRGQRLQLGPLSVPGRRPHARDPPTRRAGRVLRDACRDDACPRVASNNNQPARTVKRADICRARMPILTQPPRSLQPRPGLVYHDGTHVPASPCLVSHKHEPVRGRRGFARALGVRAPRRTAVRSLCTASPYTLGPVGIPGGPTNDTPSSPGRQSDTCETRARASAPLRYQRPGASPGAQCTASPPTLAIRAPGQGSQASRWSNQRRTPLRTAPIRFT